ncbi:MAG TPA: YlxR family protein [Candidatus Scatomorpha stercorigallinarum]|nr:YlxR family protein [Candidatus Scatomorpha stercorigallinarum]
MVKKIPMRQCLGCREMKPKRELLRVVRSPEGEVSLDTRGKKPGRGAYVCPNADCLKKAIKSRALSRALETEIPEEVMQRLAAELEEGKDGQGA